MEETFLQFIQQNPSLAYWAVYGMLLLCGFGLPLPEDITLIVGGYTVYLAEVHKLGSPSLIPMIVVGIVGVLTGDTTLFLLGKWLGPKAVKIWPFRWLLSESRRARVHRFFKDYGVGTAFFTRFAAGLRAPTYLLAGSAGMKFHVFFLADGAAALISVPLLVWLAWHFGAEIDQVKHWLKQSKYAVAAILVFVAGYIVVKILLKKRRVKAVKEN